MKKLLLLFSVCIVSAQSSLAQWLASGSQIYYNGGNVGIGTTAGINAKLHVVGPSTGSGLTLFADGGGDFLLNSGGSLFFDGNYSYASGNYIRPVTSNTQAFFTSGLERMRIASNGNVGIGTTTPGYKLGVSGNGNTLSINPQASGVDIHSTGNFAPHYQTDFSIYNGNIGSGSLKFRIDATGNVGIGTTTPVRPLHINNNGGGIVRLQSSTATWDIQSDAFYNGNFGVVNYTGGSADATKSFMINGSTGNVGIGTTNPGSYKLAVEGKIGAREVNVIATNPWPDYVFEKEYKLTSLEEIKTYIDQNKHLPEMPSATEVEKNGVNLGEMNALLLKKIEELTLHILKQEERIKALEAKK